MFEFNGKKFLNEQEAILWLLGQVTNIKQSMGSALPDPIQGPQGPTGATGATGPSGARGPGVFGCTAALPSATGYIEGDMYILFNGNVYKKVGANWVLQMNIKGPQGPVGLTGGSEVIANPLSAATDELKKVTIDGTTYSVSYVGIPESGDYLGLNYVSINGTNYFVGGSWAKYLSPVLYEDEGQITCDELIEFTQGVNADEFYSRGNGFSFDDDVEVQGNITTEGLNVDQDASIRGKLQVQDTSNFDNDIDLTNGASILFEGINRFVEGDINLTATAANSFTKLYGKWSLSGSHLMIVLAVRIANGVTWSSDVIAELTNLPSWIVSKIQTIASVEVVYATADFRASNHSRQTANLYLEKYGNNPEDVKIYLQGFTATDDRQARFAFDLLIDMA